MKTKKMRECGRQDGDVGYWFELDDTADGGNVMSGLYVCLVNDPDYDFMMVADVVINVPMRKVFLTRAEAWWKNGEWNAVRLRRGGMHYCKWLMANKLVDRHLVLGRGLVEALFAADNNSADECEGWRVHWGFRKTHQRCMRRWMVKKKLWCEGWEDCPIAWVRKTGELETEGNRILEKSWGIL